MFPEDRSNWWQQIRNHYQESGRYYHTLNHIDCMFKQMDKVVGKLQDTEAVSLAILFHDVIYDPTKSDNEQRSADLFRQFAVECLSDWQEERIQKVFDWILATQKHQASDEKCLDLMYFLDIDLQVLGWPVAQYDLYASQIRQEYSFVPEDIYRQKRPEVLKNFLKRLRLYQTDDFYEEFEIQARSNLQREISRLESG